ncbi:hypothetical protein RF11_02140 [Thelohanellus kitauei]|uniref:Uncharacterized protein n=1 Tax=Thelohanellus kitauei TaxID=669202 RepID=A0A0C2M8L3_THEKT|nr:hypothetical protein RF11_02140 [Thelohanellus kitauei]
MKETFKIDTLRPWLTNPYLFRLFGCWMNLEELNAEDFILRREEAPDTSHQTAANEESGSSDPQPIPNQESPTVVPILPEKNSEKENSVPSKEISTAVPFSEKEATTNVGLHQNVTQDETPQSNPSKHALIFSLLMLASCFIAFGFVGCVQTIYVEVGRDFLKKLKILK